MAFRLGEVGALAIAAVGAILGVVGLTGLAAAQPRRERRGAGSRCLQAGKGNVKLDVPEMQVCLTESQYEHLQPGKKIGCGVFACAYERPDGKVVKITQDPTDIATLMEGQDQDRIVKLFEARRLAGENLYAAVVERLDHPGRNFRQMINRMPMLYLADHFDKMAMERKIGPEYTIPYEKRIVFGRIACERYGNPGKRARCTELVTEVLNLHTFYGKKGIRLIDLHAGNFGLDPKTGDWKVLDAGFSKSGEPQIPVLSAGDSSPVRGRLLRG